MDSTHDLTDPRQPLSREVYRTKPGEVLKKMFKKNHGKYSIDILGWQPSYKAAMKKELISQWREKLLFFHPTWPSWSQPPTSSFRCVYNVIFILNIIVIINIIITTTTTTTIIIIIVVVVVIVIVINVITTFMFPSRCRQIKNRKPEYQTWLQL